MDTIPIHMRITGLIPSNEDVNSRRAAVADLAAIWGKSRESTQILNKAAQVAGALGGDGTPDAALGEEVESAVQKHASAFLSSDRPLEVGVCAGIASMSIMSPEPGTSGWTVPDIYSNVLWSALGFQPVLAEEKRENLRREVLDRAQERSLKSADKARERDAVPDPIDLVVTIAEEQKVTTNFKKAASGAIEALRRNAALDREELDFLWWAQLNHSRLLKRGLAHIAEPTRLVVAGIEAAGIVRRLPAEVNRELVLRTLQDDPELDLIELLQVIGEDRAVLGTPFLVGHAATQPTVFPLLHALASGSVIAKGAAIKRRASDWGSRALLEASLWRMLNTGIIKL